MIGIGQIAASIEKRASGISMSKANFFPLRIESGNSSRIDICQLSGSKNMYAHHDHANEKTPSPIMLAICPNPIPASSPVILRRKFVVPT